MIGIAWLTNRNKEHIGNNKIYKRKLKKINLILEEEIIFVFNINVFFRKCNSTNVCKMSYILNNILFLILFACTLFSIIWFIGW